jgi:hypothetical protein
MKIRLTLIAFFVLALSTSAVVFGKRSANKQADYKRLSAMREQDAALPRSQLSIPEHITYGFFFNRIIAVQQRATGRPDAYASGQVIRTSIEREANLSDAQLLVLNNIAFVCTQQLRGQDKRAGQIIAAFRARYPKGIVPPGESLPPPPTELKAMQEERNAIVLRARDQLRRVFGEQVFNRLDEILKRDIASNVQISPSGASQTGSRSRQ